MNVYADWIGRRILAERAPADPLCSSRALTLIAGSLARIPDMRLRQLFRAKLAALPYVEATALRDETVQLALGLKFEHVRILAPGAVVSEHAYISAIIEALHGREATLIDRAGRCYDVRAISFLHATPPFPTVVYVCDDGHVVLDADFRVHFLALAPEHLRAALARHSAQLDMTSAATDALANELGALAPSARLQRLDLALRTVVPAFLAGLAQRFETGEHVSSHELLPYDASGLERYVGGDAVGTDERARRLMEYLPFEEVFSRLAGLPVTMPSLVFERFDELSSPERRRALRFLSVRAATPIARMHLLRLALRHVDSAVAQRLTSLTIRWLVSHELEIHDYLLCVDWFANELWRKPECKSWKIGTRITTAWVLANQVLSLMRDIGYGFTDMRTTLPLSVAREASFFGDAAEVEAPSHPGRVGVDQLLACGLADALVEHPEALGDKARNLLDDALRGFPAHTPWKPSLYFAVEERPDAIGSYLSGSRLERLRFLLADRFTDADAGWFSYEYLQYIWTSTLIGDPSLWVFVASRLLGDSAPPPLALQLIGDEIRQRDPRADLWAADRVAWRLRLVALGHVAAITGGETAEAFNALWRKCLTVLSSQGTADGNDAESLLQASSQLARRLPSTEERRACLISDLEALVAGPTEIALVAGHVAQLLRDRLPADQVESRISRIILTARALA
ncbi:MAG: hypothetical protein EPN49_16185 [Rhodanobacter sp.]|nr:MAG: hypothetical protein EPN49_16185 [Rhodanobacter sp.]